MMRRHTLAAVLAVAIGSSSAASAQEHPVAVFEAGPTFPGSAHAVAVGDLDRDGRDDAAVILDGALRIYYGADGGLGARQQDIALPSSLGSPRHIALGDLTGDGARDVVVLSALGYVDVLTGPEYVAWGTVMAASGAIDLALGDVNGDGRLDVVVRTPNSIVVLPNGGQGLLAPVATPTAGVIAWTHDLTAVGDVTGDGLADVVTIAEGQPMVHRASAAGSFGGGVDAGLLSTQTARSVALADMNKDGRLDIVALTPAPFVLLNNGDGTFSEAGSTSSGVVVDVMEGGGAQVALADYNGDGHLDVAAFSNGGPARLYAGSAAGVPRGETSVEVQDIAADFAPGDFDGDGFADLIMVAPDRAICYRVVFGQCVEPWTMPGSVRVMHGRLTFATLQLTVEALRVQLEQFRTGNPLEAQVADLSAQLSDANERALAHQGETAAAYSRIGALEISIAAKDSLISERDATIAAKNAEIAGLRADLAILVQTNTGLQNSLTAANRIVDSLVRYAFVQAADVHAATAARDRTRQHLDRASGMVGLRSAIIVAAESDYRLGMSAMAAGSYATALTSFDNAYTRVQKY
jgi:uncharacterized coiled-coil protein SlyX